MCADDATGPSDPLDLTDSGDASVFLRGEKTWLLKLSRLLLTMTSKLGLLKSWTMGGGLRFSFEISIEFGTEFDLFSDDLADAAARGSVESLLLLLADFIVDGNFRLELFPWVG